MKQLLSLCVGIAVGGVACGEIVPIVPDAGRPAVADANQGGDDVCDGVSVALEDLEACYVQRQCEKYQRCLPGVPTQEFCKVRVFDINARLGGPSASFFDDLTEFAMSGTYNGALAANCLQSIAQGACNDNGGNAACDDIVNGLQDLGEECNTTFDCKRGFQCSGANEFTCDLGVCKALGAPGESCGDCLPGLRCVNSKCSRGEERDPCSNNGDCRQPFYCDGTSCQADTTPGSGCNETLTGECPGDQECVAGKCTDVNAVGAPCAGQCWGNLFCNSSEECEERPAPGSGCSALPSDDFSPCNDFDYTCISGICALRAEPASACTSSLDCELGTFCSSEIGAQKDTCVPPTETGACRFDEHCIFDLCDQNQGLCVNLVCVLE